MSIASILADPGKIKPGKRYELQEIYHIVQQNETSLPDDWQHIVRGVISKGKVGTRQITCVGHAQYKFF